MPTNEERREIAAKLHAIDRENFASSYSEEFETIENILGIYEDYDKFIWHVIADLIEPEPERTCKRRKFYDGGGTWYEGCSKCRNPLDERDLFCSKCGAKVVDE